MNDRNKLVVGRAEWKLAEAVEGFGFDFRGKTVLDIGSSTGGFTELALKKGARKVIAVEKGTRQMKAPLRFDERVELHEKTDIFEVGVRNSGASGATKVQVEIEPAEVVLADVSFVSLRPILEKARELAVPGADFLVMLKPQFEARSEQLARGVVKNERMRREIMQEFERWLKTRGWVVVRKRDNETVGRKGNRERFYWLRVGR